MSFASKNRWQSLTAILTFGLAILASGVVSAQEVVSIGAGTAQGALATAGNTTGGFSLVATPTASMVVISANYTSGGGANSTADARMRLVGPGGIGNIDVELCNQTLVGAGAQIFASFSLNALPVGNGAWTYEVYDIDNDLGATAEYTLANLTVTFNGPLALPYSQPFNAYRVASTANPNAAVVNVGADVTNRPGSTASNLPFGFMEATGAPTAGATTFTVGPRSDDNAAGSSGWVEDSLGNATTVPANTGAVRANNWDGGLANQWLITPAFDFGGSPANFQLFFDATTRDFGLTTSNVYAGATQRFAVLISDAGGTTWSNNLAGGGNVLFERNAGTPFTAGTNNYSVVFNTSGVRRLAFYTTGGVGALDVDTSIDNLNLGPLVPSVTLGDASIAEGDSGTFILSFPVTVGNPSGTINFTVNTSNGTATTADNDYVGITAGAGSVTGASGTVDVTINGDEFPENNETFTVTISGLSGGALLVDGVATGTITDDDFVGVASFNFETDIAGTAPVGWTQVLGSDLTSAATNPWEVDLAAAASGGFSSFTGNATLFAFINDDRDDDNTGAVVSNTAIISPVVDMSTAVFGRMRFDRRPVVFGDTIRVLARRDSNAWVTLATYGATAAWGNETITLPGSVLGGNFQVAFSHNDNSPNWGGAFGVDNIQIDAAGLPSGFVALSVANASASEGDTVNFVVTSNSAPAANVDVTYSFTDGDALGGGVDYSATAGTATILAGNTSSAPIPVTTVDADAREDNETFTITLGTVTGSAVISTGTATGTITNDEVIPADFFFGIQVFPTFDWVDADPDTFNTTDTYYNNNPPSGASFWWGGDFAGNNFNTFYAADINTGNLDIVNTVDFSVSSVAMTGMNVAHNAIGMAWDPRTNTMFVLGADTLAVPHASTSLYSMNTTTGVCTLVAAVTPSPARGNGLFCDEATGNLFIIESNVDQLLGLNKVTGATTLIGNLGVAFANFSMEADQDDATETVYMTGIRSADNFGGIYTINRTTGAATLLQNILGAIGPQIAANGISATYVPVELSAFSLE